MEALIHDIRNRIYNQQIEEQRFSWPFGLGLCAVKWMKGFLFLVLAFFSSCSQPKEEKMVKHQVILHTNKGNIVLELDQEKAPLTVENFIKYVDTHHYDGTIFHRVINDFMIQGGGFSEDFEQKKTNAPIKNEANNGLKNVRGSIAMARTSDIHSATNQFFINVNDNDFLDFQAPNSRAYGYCVFGKVVEGMDVVDKIKKAKTGNLHGHENVPLENIVITKSEHKVIK